MPAAPVKPMPKSPMKHASSASSAGLDLSSFDFDDLTKTVIPKVNELLYDTLAYIVKTDSAAEHFLLGTDSVSDRDGRRALLDLIKGCVPPGVRQTLQEREVTPRPQTQAVAPRTQAVAPPTQAVAPLTPYELERQNTIERNQRALQEIQARRMRDFHTAVHSASDRVEEVEEQVEEEMPEQVEEEIPEQVDEEMPEQVDEEMPERVSGLNVAVDAMVNAFRASARTGKAATQRPASILEPSIVADHAARVQATVAAGTLGTGMTTIFAKYRRLANGKPVQGLSLLKKKLVKFDYHSYGQSITISDFFCW
ncbi:hypothetical protein CYMTET_18934 [Cymbomonas tetramitiformis]|uniref:Uncharacterized protein n=1 Tax=Cymbomonas tetramitiformis TaxID=36881 RepID=A0AAE0G7G4_9CHLO|nr:hypothetical protein CYMTET_18934 [Cymbomonas tetramitiformis]